MEASAIAMTNLAVSFALLAFCTMSAAVRAEENTTLYNETLRPQFHFSARQGWLNDPNGLVFYKGVYHLFFQHNPGGNDWGMMTWGHAVSLDLVHWKQLDHAIRPDKMGTIFSGSAVVDWNNTSGFQTGADKPLVAFYTAAGGTSEESKGQPFTQCIAYSTDGGLIWTKFDGNPVLPNVIGENRDPKVIWYEPQRKWIMILYLDGDKFGLFESRDTKNWRKLQEIVLEGHSECPDFFPLKSGDQTKWVMTAANGDYLLGSFDGTQFVRESGPFVGDYGASSYAVQTYSDTPGRRIQIGWMRGGEYPGMPFNQQMSFPTELKLRKVGAGFRICRTPVPEIAGLREKSWSFRDEPVELGSNILSQVTGQQFQVIAEIEPRSASEVGFRYAGQTVSYRPESGKLLCLGREAEVPKTDGAIKLEMLLDRTSIELYAAGGQTVMTSCFIPATNSAPLELYSKDGAAKVRKLEVFRLRSAWRQ